MKVINLWDLKGIKGIRMKLSASEYAEKYGITVQTVYSRIKRGALISEKINGILYVIEDTNKKLNHKLKKKIKKLKSDVKKLKVNKKYIKHLKDENIYLREKLSTNEKMVFDLYSIFLKKLPKDSVIDTEIIKKKGKKKKSK